MKDDIIQILAETKNKINQDLLSLNKTELQNHFLIGVKYPDTRQLQALSDIAVVMVDQSAGTIELTSAIANNLENLKNSG